MSRLTVAFDTGPLHGPKTGIGHAVEAMHRALGQRDDVTLVDYLLSFRAAPLPGTRRLPLPATLAHRAWARTAHPSVRRWLPEADLVHGTNYVVPPSGVPSLVSVYDCWFLRHPHGVDSDVRRAGAVLRAAIARGAVVHTSSHATEAAVRELFPGAAVRTVHLGPLPLPPLPAASPLPELEGVPYVVAIGTVEQRKNLPTLVRAFARVAREIPDVRLVLAGGPAGDSLAVDAAIDATGPDIARRVLRTGYVAAEARSWLLHHATALAYPSLDEGFGFPLLDAMQAGTPVVASTAGSIPEVAGDAALLCEPLDDVALSGHLRTLLTDATARRRLVDAGSARWQQFSWDACARELTDLYRLVSMGDLEGLR